MPHTTNDPSPQTFLSPVPKTDFQNPLRILIIGAGSRGTAYAEGTLESTNCVIAAVAEPIAYKRQVFGERFIWGEQVGRQESNGDGEGVKKKQEGQEFEGWREWVDYGT